MVILQEVSMVILLIMMLSFLVNTLIMMLSFLVNTLASVRTTVLAMTALIVLILYLCHKLDEGDHVVLLRVPACECPRLRGLGTAIDPLRVDIESGALRVMPFSPQMGLPPIEEIIVPGESR